MTDDQSAPLVRRTSAATASPGALKANLAAQVRAWIDDDPDPHDREELEQVLRQGDESELEDRFRGPLKFGTAGLRGPLRAGPNGMNRAVVRRAAAGLGAYLGAGRTVVIGYDARHRSHQFAQDTAAVLTGAGLRALVLPRALPTPVLAFALRHLDADAGVMVTASHNPPHDNGYKVYLGARGDHGAQIIPPADREIESRIASVGPVRDLAFGDPVPPLDTEVVDAYVQATAALSLVEDRAIRVAYTPLHGVGRDTLLSVFSHAGLTAPAVEPSQADPDPNFPTLPFPNPEEPGAMDRVIELGRHTRADLVIANDPDADRCAVAVDGRRLSGDDLGVLLADHVLSHRRGLVATTIVSSTMLSRLAAARGVRYAETLTGFKWIMRAGDGLVYGYEQAIGYAVGPDVVRDKDGISAALLVTELAARLRAEGRTLSDRLDDLHRELGVHATNEYDARVDIARIPPAMARLRKQPPSALAGRRVIEIRDLLLDPRELPAADVFILHLDRGRVVIRPSGTEAKLKAYLETVVPVTGNLAAARATADNELRLLRGAVIATLSLMLS
ncbi:MAG: phospho-sugar mutase [Actinomycetota bacterium]|nr:phospho-sugar mutase [Actinomycetota bacterium]